ncbi:helix-turn-helix transcriptional regulator [Polymorphospora sp. NPDC050346]|uniref:helix-turn-helix domain-containing protein n=1 Tax=Polymorphospora sp. NPDC050346 TaxID=3155780 RepID=UPI0033FFB431
MPSRKDLPRDIGGFIRDLRHNARISMRQLADQAGVSNPYLSQIERGLRKPSAEVLQQLASALRVSAPMLYLRAGLLDAEGEGVLAAIATDPDLTIAQKQSLSQIYETFRRENARQAEEDRAAGRSDEPADTELNRPTPGKADLEKTPPAGTPADGVLESVAVTETGATPAPTTETPVPAKKVAQKAISEAADPAAEEEKS